MSSSESVDSARATVDHHHPFHFSRYRSKSVPAGPRSQPLCVPAVLLR
jgi:hypothetical protein